MPVTPHNLHSAGAPWTVVGGYASFPFALCPKEYTNPLIGVGLPISRHASYHVMAGYAYVNPLAGLIPHITCLSLPCYGRLCLRQPLSGVEPSHHVSLSHNVMAGYAYINPLAGLIPHITCLSLPCYGRLCLRQPLSGVDYSPPLSLSPYVIGGYAYINPLAGLIICGRGGIM